VAGEFRAAKFLLLCDDFRRARPVIQWQRLAGEYLLRIHRREVLLSAFEFCRGVGDGALQQRNPRTLRSRVLFGGAHFQLRHLHRQFPLLGSLPAIVLALFVP